MANDEHVAMLKQGVDAWNAWRDETHIHRPDLSGADLKLLNLTGADLKEADLSGADLSGANLIEADLRLADLHSANLSLTFLMGTILIAADLRKANLFGANLFGTNLMSADLRDANLENASLLKTYFSGANLTGCNVYGTSAWSLRLENTTQQDLVITPLDEPKITVDNIEVAQFIYLMLHNEKVRDVIDTITSKAVLILGRFTDERRAVLDALRDELRNRNYLPILFDFEKPGNRSTDETITLLARMARFIIADVSDAKSVLQELRGIVPDLPSVPVQPIILATQEEPGMFDHYRHMQWVLPVHRYTDQKQLLADLGDKVIHPAELKVQELRG